MNEQFESDWQKATLNITGKSEKVVRATALQLFSAVIMGTPVGNASLWKTKYPPKGYVGGRLRGNWQCTIGEPSDAVSDEPDPDGGATVGRAAAVIADYKLGPSLYLANNLPYAQWIEDGNSTQRPNGMVAINVAEFQRVIDAKALETNK